jgi:hypothetical protein
MQTVMKNLMDSIAKKSENAKCEHCGTPWQVFSSEKRITGPFSWRGVVLEDGTKKLEPLEALEYFGALNADHAQLAHDALVSGSMRDTFFGSGVLDPASRVTVVPGVNLYASPSLPQQTITPEALEAGTSEPSQTQNAPEFVQPSSVTFAPTGNADLACIQIYDRGFSRFTHVNHLSHDQALERFGQFNTEAPPEVLRAIARFPECGGRDLRTFLSLVAAEVGLELLVIDPNDPTSQHEIIRRISTRAEA